VIVDIRWLASGFAILTLPASAAAQTVSTAYTDGDTFGYVIESRVTIGEGEHLYTARATSHHVVEAGEYVTSEFITFTGAHSMDHNGDVTDLGELAASVEPWQVSLEAMGGVPFPLTVPADMAAIMGDLQTLYRAAHPAFGAHRISQVYDMYENGESHSREWASPDGTAYGGNCLTGSVQLTRLTDETALIRAVFSAPEEACIDMPGEAFNHGVVGQTPHNYFRVSPGSDDDHVNLLTGRETVTAYVTLDRATGRILSGELRQTRSVVVTADCPLDFDCAPGYPTEFGRETTLTAIAD